ncbi:MAG: GMC family oxidoreductase [Ketobacteraceae bacterium]|nr:GMC family oxidoreductase [Ketobacteraceae bacterium]
MDRIQTGHVAGVQNDPDRLKVITGADMAPGEHTLTADAVVIGSGAGGAVMAYELARAGKKVVILEAGDYVPSREFNEELPAMLEALYADHGMQTNRDGDLTILQGQCVGGSTVVNGCVAFRVPDFILDEWARDHGLDGINRTLLDAYYEKIEQYLSVHENHPHEINANSRKLQQGAEKLGWSVKPLQRNVKQCGLTGHCLAGCKTDRKQSMLVTYLPWALQSGATLYANSRVNRILADGNRATGVTAETFHPQTREKVADITVRAPVVVVAAGAVQSPLLFLQSGLANRSGMVGRNFACHPSLMVAADFGEPVHIWRGAMLGNYVNEFEHPEKGGFVLEGGGAGPLELSAACDVGTGKPYVDFIANARNYASCVTLIHDHNVGRVSLENGRKVIDYRISDQDFPSMIAAIKAAARIYFAAGAKRVFLPTVQSVWLDPDDDIDKRLDAIQNEPFTFRMVSYHPQGTLRMGNSPDHSVVSATGETHDVKGLFVADASLFPTSVLVNPQMTVYAMSNYIADRILQDHARYFTGAA